MCNENIHGNNKSTTHIIRLSGDEKVRAFHHRRNDHCLYNIYTENSKISWKSKKSHEL